jgi:molybdopterin-guanine dinucleotide biosynthesis protein A
VENGEERPAGGGRGVAAVLAGGAGSRLGGFKPAIELAGRPLISHVLAAVAESGLEPLVVARPESPLPQLGAPVLREPAGDPHPLRGIVAALRESDGRPTVVLACDMPFLSGALIAWLGSARQGLAVPSIGGVLQPLLARYDSALLPRLESALGAGAALRRTVEELDPAIVSEAELRRFGDPACLAFNVNTQADLELAERLLREARG